jgi:anti-anti-sigma regulatory factor
MEISESSSNGIAVLKLSGRLDGIAAPELEKKLEVLIMFNDQKEESERNMKVGTWSTCTWA